MGLTKVIIAVNDIMNLINLVKNAIHPNKTSLENKQILDYCDDVVRRLIEHKEGDDLENVVASEVTHAA